jgi:ribosomal protein S18 acetylase RimI-like enzyme
MASYSIRNYLLPSDLSQLALLHARIYFEEKYFGIGFEVYVMESLVEFYKQYNEEKDRVWVVDDGGKMVGFLSLMHRPENQAQLRYFILEKAYRSQGLGRRLMQEWMVFYREKGYAKAYLYTTSGLDAAAHLYESFGFKRVSEKLSEEFGVPLNEIRFELY